MKVNPKVSLIVPVYNVEEYVEECINSCLHQTYPNIEIVIIDDGSTDSSRLKLKRLKLENPELVMIFSSNAGLSAARNRGLDVASGEYVMFVDSDDVLFKNTIQIVVDSMSTDTQMVWFEAKRFISLDSEKIFENEINISKLSSRDAMIELLKRNMENYSCAMLVNKDIYEEYNIRFPVGRKYEDVATTYKIIGACKQITLVHAGLYLYREREKSITMIGSTQTGIDIRKSLNEFEEFITAKQDPLYYQYFHNFAISFLLLAYYDSYKSQDINSKSLCELIKREILEHFKSASIKYLKWKFVVACVLIKLNLFIVTQNIRINVRNSIKRS